MAKQEDYDIIKMGKKEYRESNRDIYSSSKGKGKAVKKRRKKKRHTAWLVCLSLLCCIALAFGGVYAYAYSVIEKIEQQPLWDNLGITTDNYNGVKNIALLGIDSRKDSNIGRSDAIIILSLDKKNNKIKLTSIARDSYVDIEGHGGDKLTHAYAYGRQDLAVNTLNRNFGLEITDYVTVNFYGFANIVDSLGGVMVEIDEAELNELNRNIIPYIEKEIGTGCPLIETTGVQRLSGIQALCYSRIRHIDSDVERGNRQKEVISAMLSAVKDMNPIKLPELAEMVMRECTTSLDSDEIMSMGIWAVVRSPLIERHSIPNDDVKSSGKTVNGVWCYYYDREAARKNLEEFILE